MRAHSALVIHPKLEKQKKRKEKETEDEIHPKSSHTIDPDLSSLETNDAAAGALSDPATRVLIVVRRGDQTAEKMGMGMMATSTARDR